MSNLDRKKAIPKKTRKIQSYENFIFAKRVSILCSINSISSPLDKLSYLTNA